MDPPVAAEAETKTEKTEKAKSYDCGLCDTEVVYKIAQELLPGLASACVDNTTGGLFTTAGSVAVDMRKEMTDYLTQRSETYVAEFLLSENSSMVGVSEHPYDIIMHLLDDFASSKTNMFSRVSEWVLSDRREDRIDDFVQEMEINGFWLLARREYVASILLKNVDYKNSFHCNMVCSSDEELVKHRADCKFRPMDCTNEGCTTRYCAAQKEHHEAVCPFMVLPCEQKCSDFVMRREMDRHCVTICPMKLVNCAFYTIGCSSSIPRCNVQQHNADDLSSHLLYILRTAHKEAGDEDLKHRVEQILSLSNKEKLARARDARALTYLIKDAEAKLGSLDVKTKPQDDSNKKESPAKPEPSAVNADVDSPKSSVDHQESQSANEMTSSTEKPVITEDNTKSPAKEDHPESSSSSKDKDESFSSPVDEQDEHKHNKPSPKKEEDGKQLAAAEEHRTRSAKGENVKDESSNTLSEKTKESSVNDDEETKKSARKETVNQVSSRSDAESTKSTGKDQAVKESNQREKTQDSSGSDDEESMKSPLESPDHAR